MNTNRFLLAYGYDPLGKKYEFYDYGKNGFAPKTINGLPSYEPLQFVCFCDGRVFSCANDKDLVFKSLQDATEKAEWNGSKGTLYYALRYRACYRGETPDLEDEDQGKIVFWTMKEILDEINTDRSSKWTDYDEADWRDGLDEWTWYEPAC